MLYGHSRYIKKVDSVQFHGPDQANMKYTYIIIPTLKNAVIII